MKHPALFAGVAAVSAMAVLAACSQSNSAPSAAGLGEDCVGEAGIPWDGTTAKTFACGSGTALGPYVIVTAEQLAHLSFVVNSGDKNFSGKYFKLGADIALNEGVLLGADGKLVGDPDSLLNWTPIGNDDVAFDGVFDGDGHVVSGMFIDATGPNNGLFGNVSGTVRNVTVEDSWVRGGNSTGGIVGKNVGTVENATNRATVSGTGDCTGGVVGRSDKKDNRVNSVLKKLLNEGVVSGEKQVGGVAGCVSNATIEDVENNATVDGLGVVGGIFGSVGGYSLLNVSVEMEKLVNGGTVRGKHFVGGIAGSCGNAVHIYGDAKPSIGCYESLCFCGKVEQAKNTGSVEGENYVGGVFGAVCNANVKELGNAGHVDGGQYTSGVIGYSGYATSHAMYNVGDVSGSFPVGGIFAESQKGIASAAYSTGEVSGDSLVGLMIGYGYGVTIADYYYLKRGEQAPFGLNDGGGEATAKNEAEMKTAAFVELLGDGFVRSDAVNDGLPVFAWETE